jgi:L-aminoadipate-semialdehyde dehydrogenase
LKAFRTDLPPQDHSSEDHPHRESLFKVRFFNMTDTTPDTLRSTKTSSSSDVTVFISQSPSLRRMLPIQIKLVYNSVLFSQSRIAIMLSQLQTLLQTASKEPSVAIGKLSLLDDSQKYLPDPKANLLWDQFEGAITDIFSRNAEKHPDRVCVIENVPDVVEPRVFTYKDINRASNVLAHHLIGGGIKREDVVVLYSYRGVDLVVAVMGVLKAGATFSVIGIQ